MLFKIVNKTEFWDNPARISHGVNISPSTETLNLPFFPDLRIPMMSVILYVCPMFSIWFEYPDLLLFLMAWMRFLYLLVILNVPPVCLVYFNGQSRHFTWLMPLLYFSVYVRCFNIFFVLYAKCLFYSRVVKNLGYTCMFYFFAAIYKYGPFCARG
jgi:hypothetical protein